MKPHVHFLLQVSFFIIILIYLYNEYECDETLIMSDTNNPRIDERPIWLCPKKTKISRLTHIYNQERKEQSMGIFDKFSVTHLTHGFIFFWIFYKLNNNKKTITIIYLSIFAEILWELLENTPYVIYKYRNAHVSMYRNYIGDSIANIVSDVLFTIFGLIIAWYLPPKSWLPIIIVSEILTYLIVNDNITKNMYHLFLKYL
jgi:hypothetical protein